MKYICKCGRFGYITFPVSESPLLQSGGQNQNRAHMWAVWPQRPRYVGDPHCFKAGDKIRIGPPCGRFGYITPDGSRWGDMQSLQFPKSSVSVSRQHAPPPPPPPRRAIFRSPRGKQPLWCSVGQNYWTLLQIVRGRGKMAG